MIAVPITEETTDGALAAMEDALLLADLVELRLDLMKEFDLERLLAKEPGRKIVTARPVRQGGGWQGNERTRVWTLKQAIRRRAGYVDVELDSAHDFADPGGSRLILSHHDFERTPDDLQSIVLRMEGAGADIAKVACLARDQLDNLKLLALLERRALPIIALAMGEMGLPTRVLARKFGAFLTFASLGRGRESAPGQPTVRELLETYRYRSVSSSTAVYGVIGNPVAQSASPAIMNRAFDALGMDAVYLPFLVEDVCAFVRGFEKLDVRGYSVTIPHKRAVMDVVSEIDAPARKVGAVNTLLARDGKWFGANTDLEAAVAAVEGGFRALGKKLEGSRVLVLGAGGAARAAVWGLVETGAAVTVANRTHERAVTLAAEAGAKVVPVAEAADLDFDGVVNATSVGMYPNVDETALAAEAFHAGQVVFDAVYNPRETRFLREARERGATTVSGVEMFIGQAAGQIELWSGARAPVEVMRQTLVERLNG